MTMHVCWLHNVQRGQRKAAKWSVLLYWLIHPNTNASLTTSSSVMTNVQIILLHFFVRRIKQKTPTATTHRATCDNIH